MNKKLTVTIGIPAHNEEANIVYLLKSILGQRGNNFVIEKIIVACDGCTDNTANLVKEFKHKKIEVIEDGKRKGKMARLNEIYSMNKSEILFTFDADVVLKDDSVVKKMIRVLQENKEVCLVCAHQIPVSLQTFVGKILSISDRIWQEIRIPVGEGDHIYNLQGSACGLRKFLTEKVRYPSTLSTDQGYLYMIGKKYGSFKYVRNAAILYRPPDNLYDFWLLASRSIFQDRLTMVKHFGEDIEKEYLIPLKYKIRGIAKMIIQNPLYTTLALLLNVLVRTFPRKDKAVTSKTWEMAQSARKAITL